MRWRSATKDGPVGSTAGFHCYPARVSYRRSDGLPRQANADRHCGARLTACCGRV